MKCSEAAKTRFFYIIHLHFYLLVIVTTPVNEIYRQKQINWHFHKNEWTGTDAASIVFRRPAPVSSYFCCGQGRKGARTSQTWIFAYGTAETMQLIQFYSPAIYLVPILSLSFLPLYLFIGTLLKKKTAKILLFISASSLLVPRYPLIHFLGRFVSHFHHNAPDQPEYRVVAIFLLFWQTLLAASAASALPVSNYRSRFGKDLEQCESGKTPPLPLWRLATAPAMCAVLILQFFTLADTSIAILCTNSKGLSVYSVSDALFAFFFANEVSAFILLSSIILITHVLLLFSALYLFKKSREQYMSISALHQKKNAGNGALSVQSQAILRQSLIVLILVSPLLLILAAFCGDIDSVAFSGNRMMTLLIPRLVREFQIILFSLIPLFSVPFFAWVFSLLTTQKTGEKTAVFSLLLMHPAAALACYYFFDYMGLFSLRGEAVYHLLKSIPMLFLFSLVFHALRKKYPPVAGEAGPFAYYCYVLRPLTIAHFAGMILIMAAWTMFDHSYQSLPAAGLEHLRLIEAIGRDLHDKGLMQTSLLLYGFVPALFCSAGLFLTLRNAGDC